MRRRKDGTSQGLALLMPVFCFVFILPTADGGICAHRIPLCCLLLCQEEYQLVRTEDLGYISRHKSTEKGTGCSKKGKEAESNTSKHDVSKGGHARRLGSEEDGNCSGMNGDFL